MSSYLMVFDDGVEVVVNGTDAVLEAVAVASPYDVDCVVVLVGSQRAGRWRTGGWSVDALADWLMSYPHAPLRLNAVNRGGRLWFEGGRVADMPHREARHHREARVTLLPEDDDDSCEPVFEVRYE